MKTHVPKYGGQGFPHLSRIFPPISSSSSTSFSTDSDIQVSGRYRFRRKCACVVLVAVVLALGVALGIYGGVKFLSVEPAMEQIYRGSFTVKSGDTYTSSLADSESYDFKHKSNKYKGLIDSLYTQSVVKNAFLGSEILAFDGVINGALSVFFNLHVDTHRIRVDAGDLFITLADTLRNMNGILNGSIVIDQDSLEIQERSIAFLYLPSTERNYVSIGGTDESYASYEDTNDKVESSTSKSTSISSSSSTSSTTTTRRGAKHQHNNQAETPGEKRKHNEESRANNNRGGGGGSNHHSNSHGGHGPPSSPSPRRKNGGGTSTTTTQDYDNRSKDDLADSSSENTSSQSTKVITTKTVTTSQSSSSSEDQCVPMNVDFCVNITGAAKQNQMDELTMLQLATVVDSQCYPFAANFLCSWGIACKEDDLVDHHGRPLLLCKDYCEEFMTNCGHKLTKNIKDKIQCGGECKGPNSCITKPGCVAELYNTGQKKRICDGVMDCIDFSDELHCLYCPPGNFHCGAGRECIPPEKKCDGNVDCPNGSDEKACLTLAPSQEAAGYVHQYFNEGYLFVHDQGRLGKLCVERNESSSNSLWEPESQLLLDNIGSSACELLGFRKVAFVRIQPDTEASHDSSEKNEGNYVRIQEPGSSSEVTFSAGTCPSRKVLCVGCNHLECGQRPSHQRVSKGWAFHGDWPWHAGLLKDGQHVCDATLVTSQWLLTSDQCFTGTQKARWTVHYGRVRMSTTSPWQQECRVVGMVKSPLGDNLVLIKMASPVIFSDFARHVCLPDEIPDGRTGISIPSWDKANAKCTRLGWSKADELVETPMHQLSPDSCHTSSPNSNQSAESRVTLLCFENDPPGRDCLKEVKVFPGGPIFCQNDETKEWALAGISTLSSRPKCGIEKFKVSSIASSTEWILKTIDALSNAS